MYSKIVCPVHTDQSLVAVDDGLICSDKTCFHHAPEHAFKLVKDVPILISDVLCDTVCNPDLISKGADKVPGHDGETTKRKVMRWLKLALQGRIDVTHENCGTFIEKVKSNSNKPKILIIGGAEQGQGTEALWTDPALDRTSVDIYWSPTVDLICDGHYLPFPDAEFDGVWIQAVLEHVMDPPVVVQEIHRVLKKDGYVYAETPFMQHVHAGAYDFTRYTVLGHRYLFRDFEMLSIGGTAGAHVMLRWSLKHFTRSVFRNRALTSLADIFWGLVLRPFGYFVSETSLYDSASGTFFLGQRSDTRVKHADIIKLYRGDQR